MNDNVDVSECNHFYDICECGTLGVNNYKYNCKDNPNCPYKQSKKKEQECEKYKQELHEIKEALANFCGCKTRDKSDIPICEDVEKYKQALEEIKSICEYKQERLEYIFPSVFEQILEIISKVKD